MQYNWPTISKVFRQFALNRTKILGNSPEQTLDYMGHLHLEMRDTNINEKG